MIFIFGGKSQGKLQYVKHTFGEKMTVSDLSNTDLENALSGDIIIHVQDAVRFILQSGADPVEYFGRYLKDLKGKILIGTEIGCGIVPADAAEREWRDQTGWVYQLLSKNAQRVDRVWAGIGQTLKNHSTL